MTRLNDITKIEPISLLLYAKSTFGKSWFAGTCGSRTLYINISQTGLSTLKSKLFRIKYPDSNPDIKPDSAELFLKEGFNHITDLIDDCVKCHATDYDQVVIDDLTYLSKYAMDEAMQLNSDMGRRKKFNKGKLMLSEQSDYGVVQDMFKWFLGDKIPLIKNAGMHLICLAHPRIEYRPPPKDSQVKEPMLRSIFPYVVGKDFFAPNVLPSYFDEVYYGRLNAERKREFITRGDNIIQASTRHVMELDEYEIGLDFPTLIKKIYGPDGFTKSTTK